MVIGYKKHSPVIADGVFVAQSSSVIGEVTIGKRSSVWFGAVIRGDMNRIIIGEGTNIQDNAVLHVGLHSGVRIGNGVSVGHGACIHGATVEDNCLIGMNSVVLDGAVIGKNSIVGAGAVVTSGTVIPEGSMVLGTPAKVVKKTDIKQIMSNKVNAQTYIALAEKFK